MTGIGTGTLSNGIRMSNTLNTGNGNDTITAIGTQYGLWNFVGILDTGDGNDTITGSGSIFGIYNQGTIFTGNGADSIIADGGFEVSPSDESGLVALGNGTDYLKGFGGGYYQGGEDEDTLELTPGSYTIGISGTAVNFNKDSRTMRTSGFEKLIAGSTTYDFASLTEGQTISVA